MLDPFPERPKGLHRSTYWGLMARAVAAERVVWLMKGRAGTWFCAEHRPAEEPVPEPLGSAPIQAEGLLEAGFEDGADTKPHTTRSAATARAIKPQ
jgi:hypothetical protein